MELLQWLTDNTVGKCVFTMLVSMAPVVELRGGIPFGVALGLPHWQAYLAAVIGNLIPLPFIVVYIRQVFQWMRRHMPRFNRLVDWLERKAHLKGEKASNYQYLGLMILVAIPLPGTGGWTGALAAAFLDMRLRKALPSIFLGVIIAGFLVTGITYGFTSVFV
jgi:uncharacterized membrane protein